MFVERMVSYSIHKQKMVSRGQQASYEEMTLHGGKLTTPTTCHLTKKVNKDEELTYFFININKTNVCREIG